LTHLMASDLGSRQSFFFTYSKGPLTQQLVNSNSRSLEDYLIAEQNEVALFGGSSDYFRIPLDLSCEDLVAEAEDAGISSIADIALARDDDDAFDALVSSGFAWDESIGRSVGSTQPMLDLGLGTIFLNVFSLANEPGDAELESISCLDLDLDLECGTSQLVASIGIASLKRLRIFSPSMELPNGHYIEKSYIYRRPSFGLGHLRLSSQKAFDQSMLRLLIQEEDANYSVGISYGLVEPEFSLLEEAGGEVECNEFYVLNHVTYETLEEILSVLEK